MSIALLIIFLIGVWSIYASNNDEIEAQQLVSKKVGDRLQRLWDDAFQSLKENKFLRAERALLTILKFDERNSGAYNRLGILYAKQRNFEHAIECFEIAHSLEPNASTLNNLGLIYYEQGHYQKAAKAFEDAIKEEDDVPLRYIAYAKVQEKLGHHSKMVESLEKAAKLQPNKQSYLMLLDAYKKVGRDEDAAKIEQAIANTKKLKRTRTKVEKPIKQPRKVVM